MANHIESVRGFLGLLNNVRPIRNGEWQALCPAHNDHKPSLNIKEAEGKILVYCHGGCELKDILRALNLEISDLFLNGAKPEARITATYDYTDAAGELIYQVVRYDPKGFKQRRPDGSGGWVWNLEGVTPVLYHLPEVIEAVSRGRTIFIVEGEKDCDALIESGLTATTNSGGAGKWRPQYSEVLKGGSVVIVPDRDAPGQRHATQVAASLYGKAKSIKLLELPDRNNHNIKDAHDWLAAGGTREDLEQLVGENEEWKPIETVEKSKNAEAEIKETSFIAFDHILCEQIVNGDQVAFIEYDCDTGQSKVVESVMQGEVKVIPLSSEEISLGAVKLPTGIAEYGDTLSLIKELQEYIYRYLDVSGSYRKFVAYYILLSWVYDRFNTLPYLRFIGDTGCGKSRALDVCGGLCYKSTSASGCITPAPIYRMLRKWAGTITLDEADLQNSDEYHEVTKILNCGFERNRPVIRAVKDNPDRLQILPTFGPKVFATRRRFKDAALEARCLTEIMQETTRDDIPATLTYTFYKEQEVLRNKLLLFRLRNYNHINLEDNPTLDLHGIEPRLRQISACFAGLFANHEEVLHDYRAFIEHHQRELIEQRAATTIGQVVEALLIAIESATVATVATLDTNDTILNVSAGDIAESLGMTSQAVGGIIKTLGLQTRQHRVGGKVKRLIVYDKAKLDILKRRYIPSEDVATVASVATSKDSMENIDTHKTPCPCLNQPDTSCREPTAGSFKTCSYNPADCEYAAVMQTENYCRHIDRLASEDKMAERESIGLYNRYEGRNGQIES